MDTAAERTLRRALLGGGVWGTLLSEEAGGTAIGVLDTRLEPVFSNLDPFEGNLPYRRGIRAHWFTALAIYGQDRTPKATGRMDHITGKIILADAAGAVVVARAEAQAVPLHAAQTATLDDGFLQAYLMKPPFLYPPATALRPLFEQAKFILPNGGPTGFPDVARGRIDVYLVWDEALAEVFSAIHIAERAGCVVSQWDGSSVRFRPDIHRPHSLVCSTNPRLHDEVLPALKWITPLKGFSP